MLLIIGTFREFGGTMKLSEAVLIQNYLDGDQRAFTRLVEGHIEKLLCVARRHAPRNVDAQDIVQIALWNASRNLHKFRQECALSTWLYRLVVNAAYDFGRRQSNCMYECLENIEEQGFEHNIELSIEISEALNSLSREQREAIILVDIAGTTIESVAKYQGVRPGTVKSRRARARKTLRKLLQVE